MPPDGPRARRRPSRRAWHHDLRSTVHACVHYHVVGRRRARSNELAHGASYKTCPRRSPGSPATANVQRRRQQRQHITSRSSQHAAVDDDVDQDAGHLGCSRVVPPPPRHGGGRRLNAGTVRLRRRVRQVPAVLRGAAVREAPRRPPRALARRLRPHRRLLPGGTHTYFQSDPTSVLSGQHRQNASRDSSIGADDDANDPLHACRWTWWAGTTTRATTSSSGSPWRTR